jgi:hypothetical protein
MNEDQGRTVAQLVEALRYKPESRRFDSNRSQWLSGLRRGSAAYRLLRLRVRIPLGAWLFVLCVLYSKDKRQSQDNQDKVVVQTKYRGKKNSDGIGIFDLLNFSGRIVSLESTQSLTETRTFPLGVSCMS